MLNKIACRYLEKLAEDLPSRMPKAYYDQRFRQQPDPNNYKGEEAEMVENLRGDMDVMNTPYSHMDEELPPEKQNINSVRQRQAEQSVFNMGFQHGTKEYDAALKYFLDRGRTNQYNFLHKKKKQPAPVPKNFTPQQRKVMKDWGNSIVSTNKPAGNVLPA